MWETHPRKFARDPPDVCVGAALPVVRHHGGGLVSPHALFSHACDPRMCASLALRMSHWLIASAMLLVTANVHSNIVGIRWQIPPRLCLVLPLLSGC